MGFDALGEHSDDEYAEFTAALIRRTVATIGATMDPDGNG